TRLTTLHVLPRRYYILEPSAELRERQRSHLRDWAGAQGALVTWLDSLPSNFAGVVYGNEVLDALPVELVLRRTEQYFVLGVAQDSAGAFAWSARPPPP